MGTDDLDTAERIPMSRRTLLKLAGATGAALAAGPALDLAQRMTGRGVERALEPPLTALAQPIIGRRALRS